MRKIIAAFISLLLIAVFAGGNVMASESDLPEETSGNMETTVIDVAETDFSYMFQRGSDQKRDISLSEVDHIAILFTSSPLPQSLFLDLEGMKSYYDPGRDIYYNIQVSKYINDLSEEERADIERIWQGADFGNWDFYYEGTSELDYECHFAVETGDTVYHYEIKGVDAAAPESLMDFITDLLHAFWDSEIR